MIFVIKLLKECLVVAVGVVAGGENGTYEGVIARGEQENMVEVNEELNEYVGDVTGQLM